MMLTTAHIQRVDDWMPGLLADLGSGWVKIVNPSPTDFGKFAQKSLCRIWTDDIDARYLARGRQGGRDYVRDMYPRWAAVGATAYSLWNEPPCNSNEDLVNLREATLGAVEEAVLLDLKLVGIEKSEATPGDNGTGDPNVSAWKLAQLRSAVVALADAGMYYGGHYYHRPGVEGATGRWHALGRLEWDLAMLDVPGLKVLVTECGIDGGIASHPGQQGWQQLTTEALYRSEIVAAEEYARQIPGVEALMYFGFGATDRWLAGGFDIPEGFARSLVEPLRAIGAGPAEDASGRLIIELARPLAYTAATSRVTNWFGQRTVDYSAYGLIGHEGLDYRAPLGTPILAMHPGIARIYNQGTIGLGKYIKLQYYDGQGTLRYTTRVAHLSEFRVTDGQHVERGQMVGLSGNTGNSSGAHLHMDLRIEGGHNPGYNDCVDPVPFRTL